MNRNLEFKCGKKQMKDGVGAQKLSLGDLREKLKSLNPDLYSSSQAYKKPRIEVCKLIRQSGANGMKFIMGNNKKANTPKNKSPNLAVISENELFNLISQTKRTPIPPPQRVEGISVNLGEFGYNIDPETGNVMNLYNMGIANLRGPRQNRKKNKDPIRNGRMTKSVAKSMKPVALRGSRRAQTASAQPRAPPVKLLAFGGGNMRTPTVARTPVISTRPRLTVNELREARFRVDKQLNKNKSLNRDSLMTKEINRLISERTEAPKRKPTNTRGSFSMIRAVETNAAKAARQYKAEGKNKAASVMQKLANMGKKETLNEKRLTKNQPTLNRSPIVNKLNKTLPGPKVEITQGEAVAAVKKTTPPPSTFMIGNKPCTDYKKEKLVKVASLYKPSNANRFKSMSMAKLCEEIEKLQKEYFDSL